MSTDQMAQVLKYLSAISREVGEFRQEFNSFRSDMNTFRSEMYTFRSEMYTFRDKTNDRLGSIEQEQRQMRRDLDRIHALLLVSRTETDELRERVEVLEREKG